MGETALARIASSALFQGLYNAGITAAAQPAVQKWQAEIGRESGVVPALQDVGAAFVMGMIPGAAIEGVKELAGPLGRLLRGRPEPGDLAKAGEGLGPVQPSAEAAARAGEESIAADAATLTEKPPPDVPREMHDDLIGAALKRADDPSAPSPEAVAAVQSPSAASQSDPLLEPALQQVRSMGSPMDIAQQWSKDPEGTLNRINGIIKEIGDAEKGMRERHGDKKTEDLEDEPLSKAESDFPFYGQGPHGPGLERPAFAIATESGRSMRHRRKSLMS